LPPKHSPVLNIGFEHSGLSLGSFDRVSVSALFFEPSHGFGGYGLDYITAKHTTAEVDTCLNLN